MKNDSTIAHETIPPLIFILLLLGFSLVHPRSQRDAQRILCKPPQTRKETPTDVHTHL